MTPKITHLDKHCDCVIKFFNRQKVSSRNPFSGTILDFATAPRDLSHRIYRNFINARGRGEICTNNTEFRLVEKFAQERIIRYAGKGSGDAVKEPVLNIPNLKIIYNDAQLERDVSAPNMRGKKGVGIGNGKREHTPAKLLARKKEVDEKINGNQV